VNFGCNWTELNPGILLVPTMDGFPQGRFLQLIGRAEPVKLAGN